MASEGVVRVLPCAVGMRGLGEEGVSPGIDGSVRWRILLKVACIRDRVAEKESSA